MSCKEKVLVVNGRHKATQGVLENGPILEPDWAFIPDLAQAQLVACTRLK
jgi:hypothetical protein